MALSLTVDLNCDLGEGFGNYQQGDDAKLMALVTSVNIACGFHAGDPDVMSKTVKLAKDFNVTAGAHPGYPDLQGFGRRSMTLTPGELTSCLHYQLGALSGIAQVAGVTLVHVKPHGALYNLASQDKATADVIAQAVKAFDPGLILVGLAGSHLPDSGLKIGLRIAHEGFPDRAYFSDGQLLPRHMSGALLTQPERIASQAVRLVTEGIKINNRVIKIDTLCLHGDHPSAEDNARAVCSALENAGIEVLPLTTEVK